MEELTIEEIQAAFALLQACAEDAWQALDVLLSSITTARESEPN